MEDNNLTILFLEKEIEGRKIARDGRIELGKTIEKEQRNRQGWIDRETGIIEDMEKAIEILKGKVHA